MKKQIILLFYFLAYFSTANAQSATFHAIKVDLMIGKSIRGDSSTNSYNYLFEPHYRISNSMALGLRFQSATVGDDILTHTSTNYNYSSTCASMDYYFKKSGSVLFYGSLGFGIFNETATTNYGVFMLSESGPIGRQNTNVYSDNMGVFFRGGFEIGHLRISAEYDITGGTKNFNAINLGFFIGGGKK